MYKSLFMTLLLSVIGMVPSLLGQNVRFQGAVLNENNEVLIGANVAVFKGEELVKGASTDIQGLFSLALEAGTYRVRTTYIGYSEKSQDINLSADTYLTITLESNATELRELVVTTQKRVQSIKEVPIAISSVPAEMILDNNVETFSTLSDYVPGVQIQEQVVILPSFVIRGLTSDNSNFNVENRVSVFQDGVSISKAISSYVEFFDVDRVEVLKGPQGTLFGRSAQIGAIHLVTKRPTDQLNISGQMGVGNFNQRYGQFALNAPIIPGKLLSRFSGIINQRDGYVENNLQDDMMGKGTIAGRFSLRYLPSAKTVVDLIFNYQADDAPGTSFKSGTYAPANGDTRFWTRADLDDANKELGATRDVFGATLDINHSFNNQWSLSAITGYRSLNGREIFDSDGTAANALQFDYDADYWQFSQELRFNYRTDKWSGFAGINYFIDEGDADLQSAYDERSMFALFSGFFLPQPIPLTVNGEPNVALTVNPLTGLPLKDEHQEQSLYGSRNYAYDVFADLNYRITDQWDINLGARYTQEYLESYLQNPFPSENGTLGFILTGTPAAPQPNALFALTRSTDGTIGGRYVDNRDFNAFVFRATTHYNLDDQLSFFGSISTGRRPYVLDLDAGIDANGVPLTTTNVLNDEDVTNYEIGIKSFLFDNSLMFNVSGFIYTFSNFQTSVNDLSEGELFESQDSGLATGRGLEIDSRWLIHPKFELFGNYALLNSTFDDVDSDGNRQELAGNRFRLTPRGSGALGFNFNTALSKKPNGLKFQFTPSYTFKSHHYFEDQNTVGLEQNGYGLLNLNAVFILPAQNVQIQLFANNLLDETYLIDAGNTGGAFGIPTFVAGPRRFIGTKVRFQF